MSANNPNHKDNLKPFKQGFDERRNIEGRKPIPNLREMIEEQGLDEMEAVVKALFKRAKQGDVKAINEVFNRYYGTVGQKIQHELETPQEINLIVCGSRSKLLGGNLYEGAPQK